MNVDINQGLKPGLTLRHGTYRIEKVLGQGGFGITYLAMDLNLDRYVAIKEFFPKDYCDRDNTSQVTLGTQSTKEFVYKLKAKFLKEARNIAKFDNHNIVRIHSAFEENNTAYFVMDYIEGQNLSNKVKNNGPIPLQYAIRYIKLVGKALEYVHSRKINHFDIKPANIIVRDLDDEPIIIDFGLSKQYDSQGKQTSTTPTGMSHGFAPIEQYSPAGIKEFSPQTDVYSLGATLYYILTGITPPQATQLVDEELTFPPHFPLDLIPPISKAMSSGRKKRYATVALFLEDLDKSLTDTEKTTNTQIKTVEENVDNQHISGEILDNEYTFSPTEENKPMKKWICLISITVVLIAGLFFYYKSISSETLEEDTSNSVSDVFWESPLGESKYSGEVIVDSINGVLIPNGRGVAIIISGEFEGNVYEGEFNNGKMEGEAVYKLKNGDVFEGTFKDNQYETGRYTIDEDGSYFEGTFKNMDTDKGEWRDNKGKLLK